ncbi:maleylpyruvate isomerase N-terminal domain-containing protein [Roseibium salinum]|nr:maleylpyruvate isomerase N-terminal domain-containing protein [Roseibium salinum]
MSDTLEEARAALKLRQGSGARYDAAGAPARSLDWARRGTAYFARLLNDLSDAELDAPSALPGQSRRHVIARVGYQARLLGEAIAWVREGKEGPFPKDLTVGEDDVELGGPPCRRAPCAICSTTPKFISMSNGAT